MDIEDVVLLPSRASFCTIFLNYCGRGDGLGKTTCLKTVVCCRQRHAPCEILLFQQILFLCQLDCLKIIRLSQN